MLSLWLNVGLLLVNGILRSLTDYSSDDFESSDEYFECTVSGFMIFFCANAR